MKQTISDAKLGEFILDCMRVTAAAHKLAYEIDEMCEQELPINDIFGDLEQEQKIT